jgi:hypothetical protein
MPIHYYRDWSVSVLNNCYLIDNNNGGHYRVVTGRDGEPLFDVEPRRAIPVPSCFRYQNKAGYDIPYTTLKIGGIIAKEGGLVRVRGSLTGLGKKGISVHVCGDGAFLLGEDECPWYLQTIFIKDKDLFRGGLDAFFGRNPVGIVKVLELEDLDL